MVPHLVFEAEKRIKDEFLLATIAMKAVRKMHQPGTRTEETASRVFEIVANGRSVGPPTKMRATQTSAPLIPEATPLPSIPEDGPIGSAEASGSDSPVQASAV